MDKELNLRRKKPKQNRSKALVEAIYEATVRILPSVGSDHLTTKKVADMAGVSIGSLYQYFPNKESILDAVMDKVIVALTAETNRMVDQLHGKSIEESTELMIGHVMEIFLEDKSKMREIFRKAPEMQKFPLLFKLRQKVVERLAAHMKQMHPGLNEQEYVRINFVAANAVMGVITTVLYDESCNYTREQLEPELKLLIRSYFSSRLAP